MVNKQLVNIHVYGGRKYVKNIPHTSLLGKTFLFGGFVKEPWGDEFLLRTYAVLYHPKELEYVISVWTFIDNR